MSNSEQIKPAKERRGRKLFLTDLDGTLLNDKKVVTDETWKALRDFTEAGNVFAICTGRAVENALFVQKQLNLEFPGSFAVGYNGAHIYDCTEKKTLFRVGVALPDVEKILKVTKEHGVHCHTYYREYIVSEAYNECMTFYRKAVRSPVIVADDVMSELKEEPCKLIAIELYNRKKLEDLKETLEKSFGDRYSFLFSSEYYLEIFPKEAGKGKALHILADALSIPVKNTYAAGDAQNDISMIEAAGTGIGMQNGTDPIKEAADVITEEDNNHDGLAEFIRRMTDGTF